MTVIVLVNYNSYYDTIECINSILSSSSTNYLVLVVDNSTFEEPYKKFQEYASTINKGNVVFLKPECNNGFAGGNNYAINYLYENNVNFKFIWFLNNDTIIEENTLSYLEARMLEERERNSNIHIIGCKLYYYYKKDTLQGVGGLYNKYTAVSKALGCGELDKGQYDVKSLQVDYPIGASMFVTKEFIENVGLMCEDYFLYFEELDWVKRGANIGYSIGYEYSAKVYHKEGASTKDSNLISEVADCCQVRNRLLFTKKFFPYYIFTVMVSVLLSIMYRFFRGHFRRSFILLKVFIKEMFR